MDFLKDALMKRKKGLEQGMKISIELVPGKGDGKEDGKDKQDEKDKKMGLAPEVKDAQSPKEPKLIAHGQDEVELGSRPDSPEEEDTESPQERLAEQGLADAMDFAAKNSMPEEPNGREPKSLHEKAMLKMKNNPVISKNTFGGKKK